MLKLPSLPLLSLLSVLTAGPSLAQITHAVAQTTEGITIDGLLDEAAWKRADSLVLVTNNSPGGLKPKTATSVRVLWNSTYLYVAFQVETNRIDGTITQHDGALYTQDVVEMFIDPDGDSRNYLELEWNCLNTSLDWRYAEVRKGSDTQWAIPNSKSAVRLKGTANKSSDVDTGLTYEIALAWADMKAWSTAPIPPRIGDALPVNFYRIDYPVGGGTEELIAWSPTGAADFHRPDKFGKLTFAGPTSGVRTESARIAGPGKARLLPWRGGAFSGETATPMLSADGRVTWGLPGRPLAPGMHIQPVPSGRR